MIDHRAENNSIVLNRFRAGNELRKHQLEQHEGQVRNRRPIRRVWLRTDPAQPDPIQIADDPTFIAAESQTVAKENPQITDRTHNLEALHCRAQHILAPN